MIFSGFAVSFLLMIITLISGGRWAEIQRSIVYIVITLQNGEGKASPPHRHLAGKLLKWNPS
jgi:hypothetical protein